MVAFIYLKSPSEDKEIHVAENGQIYGFSKTFREMYADVPLQSIEALIPGVALQEMDVGDKIDATMMISAPNWSDLDEKPEVQPYQITLRLKENKSIRGRAYYTLLICNLDSRDTESTPCSSSFPRATIQPL